MRKIALIAALIALISQPLAAQIWVYTSSNDKIREQKRTIASLRSQNSVNIGAPYGSIRAEVVVRITNDDLVEVLVLTTSGQILDCGSLGSGKIYTRFDKLPMDTFYCSESSDRSTNVAFVDEGESFLKALHESNKLVIELTFYQGGTQQFLFNVAGLKLPTLQEISEKRAAAAREAERVSSARAQSAVVDARPDSFENMQRSGRIGDWWAMGSWAYADAPSKCVFELRHEKMNALFPPNFKERMPRLAVDEWAHIGMNIILPIDNYVDAKANGISSIETDAASTNLRPARVALKVYSANLDSFSADVVGMHEYFLNDPNKFALATGVNFTRCK